jgi:hypothetical protein
MLVIDISWVYCYTEKYDCIVSVNAQILQLTLRLRLDFV